MTTCVVCVFHETKFCCALRVDCKFSSPLAGFILVLSHHISSPCRELLEKENNAFPFLERFVSSQTKSLPGFVVSPHQKFNSFLALIWTLCADPRSNGKVTKNVEYQHFGDCSEIEEILLLNISSSECYDLKAGIIHTRSLWREQLFPCTPPEMFRTMSTIPGITKFFLNLYIRSPKQIICYMHHDKCMQDYSLALEVTK